MFINSYGEEFELKDYMRSLGKGWKFVRMFEHPHEPGFMLVTTEHKYNGIMQQGLMLA